MESQVETIHLGLTLSTKNRPNDKRTVKNLMVGKK